MDVIRNYDAQIHPQDVVYIRKWIQQPHMKPETSYEIYLFKTIIKTKAKSTFIKKVIDNANDIDYLLHIANNLHFYP